MTIIYINGNDYFGETEIKQSIRGWKSVNRILEKKQKFMYKGYRYFDHTKDIVIVFDNVEWSKEEKARRKKNGFLGIKRYTLKKGEE